MLIFAGLSCKSTMNLYCAKCYKCNKRIFGRRKKKENHLDFFSSLDVLLRSAKCFRHCSRAHCSSALTLRVLGAAQV